MAELWVVPFDRRDLALAPYGPHGLDDLELGDCALSSKLASAISAGNRRAARTPRVAGPFQVVVSTSAFSSPSSRRRIHEELVLGSIETGVTYNGAPAHVTEPTVGAPVTVLASRSSSDTTFMPASSRCRASTVIQRSRCPGSPASRPWRRVSDAINSSAAARLSTRRSGPNPRPVRCLTRAVPRKPVDPVTPILIVRTRPSVWYPRFPEVRPRSSCVACTPQSRT